MHALLIYPQFPDTYWSFRHALSFQRKASAFPPLGLLTVSAMLPNTWEQRLIDMNVQPLKVEDLMWADIILVSAMLVQKTSLLKVIDLCKTHGKRVALGGPYVTTSPELFDDVDYIFIGEVEAILSEFIQDLECDNTKHIYKPNERPSLCSSPIPNFRLADIKRYSAMSVQYSRGCPFQCEFCDIIEIYGRVPRTKSNAQVLAELDELLRIGWRGTVFIVDDNFIGNKPNVKKLLPELIAWSERHHHPFSFLTEASVNLAEDEELLEGMRRAGFYKVFLGIETPVEESLKEAQKGQNTRHDLLDSVKKIQSYGMEVMAGFIVGFDNDPEDIFERQIKFIRESAIPLAMVGLLTALPDTQLWRRLKREGRLITESSGNNTDGSLNFIPRMELSRLIAGYRSILSTIYNPREYYQRALDSLERVSMASTQGISQGQQEGLFANLITFFNIVVTLGIRDNARSEFWRYVHRVCTQHREKFSQAITLAAMGYHFRKMMESISD